MEKGTLLNVINSKNTVIKRLVMVLAIVFAIVLLLVLAIIFTTSLAYTNRVIRFVYSQ